MMRFLIRRLFAKFGADNDYDVSYMQEVTDIWPGAGARFFGLSMVSQMKGPAPEIWAGALLASTLDGDCGPCAQLVVGAACQAGVPHDRIAACLTQDFDAAGDVGLGFRFAMATIDNAPDIDALRAEIRKAHGDRAVIAAAYATASGRTYPMIKRALGHGRECRQLTLGGVQYPVVPRST